MSSTDCSPARVVQLEERVRYLYGYLQEAVQIYLDGASQTDDLDEALERRKQAFKNSPVVTAIQAHDSH